MFIKDIKKLIDKSDFRELLLIKISCFYPISENLINKYNDKWDWKDLSFLFSFSEIFIKKHIKKINWETLSYNKNITLNSINKFYKNINLLWLSRNNIFWKKIIESFNDKLLEDLIILLFANKNQK